MNFLKQKIIDTFSRGGEEIPQSKYSLIPRFLIFVLYLLFFEIFYFIFPETTSKLLENFIFGFILLTLGFFSAFIIRPIVSLYNTYHEICPDNLISIQGFASFTRKDYLCPYVHISGIEIRQNLFDRLCNMGDILIGTSMTGSAEIRIRKIERPEYYVNQIEAAVSKALKS